MGITLGHKVEKKNHVGNNLANSAVQCVIFIDLLIVNKTLLLRLVAKKNHIQIQNVLI